MITFGEPLVDSPGLYIIESTIFGIFNGLIVTVLVLEEVIDPGGWFVVLAGKNGIAWAK